jgi:2-methylcitrate dehydratase PrpD
MAHESARLAQFAAEFSIENVPAHVVERARECLIDTFAIAVRGQKTTWGTLAVAQARQSQGPCRLIGIPDARLAAEQAAFANGLLAHALELDSLRKPGAGVHPGAIVVAAALAAAQERKATGRALLEAIIAGFEVMMRIGAATLHSAEPRGFHAPGLTGPFGAAVAAGKIYGLDTNRMNSAFGIAVSLSAGVMQFAYEGQGAMVKRLHIGRAAQNGVFAAQMAERGYEGPHEALEGKRGFLATFCGKQDLAKLTGGLGEDFETLKICLKRYPCHITAHTAIYAAECWQRDIALTADQVASIVVYGTSRMAELNGNQAPTDPALANYSIPFSLACALTGNAADPASFDPSKLQDANVMALAQKISVVSDGRESHSDWMTRSVLTLKDGRVFEQETAEFPGTPGMPLTPTQLRERFDIMTCDYAGDAAGIFARLLKIENERQIDWLC